MQIKNDSLAIVLSFTGYHRVCLYFPHLPVFVPILQQRGPQWASWFTSYTKQGKTKCSVIIHCTEHLILILSSCNNQTAINIIMKWNIIINCWDSSVRYMTPVHEIQWNDLISYINNLTEEGVTDSQEAVSDCLCGVCASRDIYYRVFVSRDTFLVHVHCYDWPRKVVHVNSQLVFMPVFWK